MKRSLHPNGENHYTVKLSWDKVETIRRSEESHTKLARIFNVSVTTIRDIRKGKIWKEKNKPLWHRMNSVLSKDLTPSSFIKWVRDRLVFVHNDNELYDFIHALDRIHKEIALEEAQEQ